MPARHIALSPEAAAVYDRITGGKGAKGDAVSAALLAWAGVVPLADRVDALEARVAALEKNPR